MTPSSSSLADRLVAVAGRAPDAPFLLRPGRSPVAYGTLARQIRHVVDRFSDWGIAPGDVVAGFVRSRAPMAMACASFPAWAYSPSWTSGPWWAYPPAPE